MHFSQAGEAVNKGVEGRLLLPGFLDWTFFGEGHVRGKRQVWGFFWPTHSGSEHMCHGKNTSSLFWGGRGVGRCGHGPLRGDFDNRDHGPHEI